jgi:putative oxidoreductase
MLRDVGVLLVRLTVGGLLAGHGAQKMLGWFGGGGLAGTEGWLEGLGFRPGRRWAWLAAASELGGGLLTAAGLLNPAGPLTAIGAMLVATLRVHSGKPIWTTEGGAELPVTNIAVLAALALAGPGRFSLDRVFHAGLPRWTALPGAAVVAAVAWTAVLDAEQRAAEGTTTPSA